jgi:hypothetical protein
VIWSFHHLHHLHDYFFYHFLKLWFVLWFYYIKWPSFIT